jgi:hypothetical protein
MRLDQLLSARVAAAVRELGTTGPEIAGREHGAIPLWADMGGAVLLRPDGTVLEFEWDDPSEHDPRKVDHPTWPVALVTGAERYPWLASVLLPIRPSNAVECPDCEGKGRRIYDGPNRRGTVYCATCNALGWRAV